MRRLDHRSIAFALFGCLELIGCASADEPTVVLIEADRQEAVAEQVRVLEIECGATSYRIAFRNFSSPTIEARTTDRHLTLDANHPMVADLLGSSVLFEATGRCAEDGLNVRLVVAHVTSDRGAVLSLTHAFFEQDLSAVHYTPIGEGRSVQQRDFDRLMGAN